MCLYVLDHKTRVKVINGTADILCLMRDNGHRPRWLVLHSLRLISRHIFVPSHNQTTALVSG